MQLQDLETMKDVPEYKAILKAVIKSQIQSLLQQLSEQTDEESVILTASVSDGSQCHLGSNVGQDFLHGRDEIKSQFLRHCLKKRHGSWESEVPSDSRQFQMERPKENMASVIRPTFSSHSTSSCSSPQSQHVKFKTNSRMKFAPRTKKIKFPSTASRLAVQQVDSSIPSVCSVIKSESLLESCVNPTREDVNVGLQADEQVEQSDQRCSNIIEQQTGYVSLAQESSHEMNVTVSQSSSTEYSLQQQQQLSENYSEPVLSLKPGTSQSDDNDQLRVKREPGSEETGIEPGNQSMNLGENADWSFDDYVISTNFGDAGMETDLNSGSEVKSHASGFPQVDDSVENKAQVRFSSPVTDDDINNLIDSKKSKNTVKKTNWGFNIFESWRKSRIKDNIPELHVMDKPTMAYWLTRFVLEVRNQKGEEYRGKTIYIVLRALLRHIRDCGVNNINFLDNKDSEFDLFLKTVDSKRKDLIQKGIGTLPRQADPISEKDEETLWDKSVFGAKDAQTLQYTMFYYNCKLFGLRGRDEHRSMDCDQFEVGEDASGRFVRFTGRNCKTFQGGIGQRSLTNKDIKHYCTEGPRCLATYYQKYLDAMGNEGCFYRRTLALSARYSLRPVGINKLDKFMSQIAKLGEIKGNITNDSSKRTCATALYNAGVDEQDISNS